MFSRDISLYINTTHIVQALLITVLPKLMFLEGQLNEYMKLLNQSQSYKASVFHEGSLF